MAVALEGNFVEAGFGRSNPRNTSTKHTPKQVVGRTSRIGKVILRHTHFLFENLLLEVFGVVNSLRDEVANSKDGKAK